MRLDKNGILTLFLGSFGALLLSLTPVSSRAQVFDAIDILHQPMPNMCALTFDDGPHPRTRKLLQALAEEGVRATFFMLGMQVQYHPDIVKAIVRAGHEVGSHGFSHANLRQVSYEKHREEIEKTHELLVKLGANARYMRPPYGQYNADTVALAKEMGMNLVLWSTDSRDWEKTPDYSNMPNILERPMSHAEMRGIFLFHDINARTVEDARLIIAALRAVGCEEFVTVSEYLAKDSDANRALMAQNMRQEKRAALEDAPAPEAPKPVFAPLPPTKVASGVRDNILQGHLPLLAAPVNVSFWEDKENSVDIPLVAPLMPLLQQAIGAPSTLVLVATSKLYRLQHHPLFSPLKMPIAMPRMEGMLDENLDAQGIIPSYSGAYEHVTEQ